MDSTSLILELLTQKGVLTPLEQDILDTYHELDKKPFERNSAIRQNQKNNINHPDIFEEISTKPMMNNLDARILWLKSCGKNAIRAKTVRL